jgi:hypothetical protein
MGKFRKVSAIFLLHSLDSLANATVSKGPEQGSVYICRKYLDWSYTNERICVFR